MATVRELHTESMKYFHQARYLRDYGDTTKKASAPELFAKAYELERKAAMLLIDKLDYEPTRSILFRGAASLALQANLPNEAIQMAGYGLAGKPPPRILKSLLRIVDDYKQTQVEKSYEGQIKTSSILMSMLGDSIVFGDAPYREIRKRVEALKSLTKRSVDRATERTYSKKGSSSKKFAPFQYHLQWPSTQNSFAINFRLVPVNPNLLVQDASQVVDEIVYGAQLLQSGHQEELKQIIPDIGYYNRFVQDIRDLSPDGTDVRHVTLASVNNMASLSQSRRNFVDSTPFIAEPSESEKEYRAVEVSGTVKAADDLSKTRVKHIGLESEDDNMVYRLVFPEGIDDIMDKYWKRRIQVTGRTSNEPNDKNNYIYVSDFSEINNE